MRAACSKPGGMIATRPPSSSVPDRVGAFPVRCAMPPCKEGRQAMKHMLYLSSVVVFGLLASAPYAAADDTLKLAVAQRTAWDSAAPELGQQVGIFKKHGIVLDLLSAQG